MRLEIHPDARKEADSAAQRYDDEEAGLGDRFFDSLNAALEAACDHPESFARYEAVAPARHVRWCKIKRFPYVVYFEVQSEAVRVLAVSHGSRREGHWIRRR